MDNIIITVFISSLLGMLKTLFYKILVDGDWYKLADNVFANTIVLTLFKGVSINFWIWPMIYVFYPRRIIVLQNKRLFVNSENSYSQFSSNTNTVKQHSEIIGDRNSQLQQRLTEDNRTTSKKIVVSEILN